jgi:arylsulfatase A-like enzyme
VKPGTVISTPVSSPDFFPTLLEAAGAKPQAGQVLDGVSLIPLLRGEKPPERALFWHYPHYGNQGGAPAAAIRDDDWKLIEWQEDGRVELFNLKEDIGEQNDLAGTATWRVAVMLPELKAWQKEVGAKFPTPNSNYNKAKPDGRGGPNRSNSNK